MEDFNIWRNPMPHELTAEDDIFIAMLNGEDIEADTLSNSDTELEGAEE